VINGEEKQGDRRSAVGGRIGGSVGRRSKVVGGRGWWSAVGRSTVVSGLVIKARQSGEASTRLREQDEA
jgi:hypothetical protein